MVHEVLTSASPFLDIGLTSADSDYTSIGTESSIDGELLMNYCAGRQPFPVESLTIHGASANGIDFVKSLMVPDPKKPAFCGWP